MSSDPSSSDNQTPDAVSFPRDLEKLEERYKIIRELGRGGMGSVFLAEDSVIYRNVAIKVLSTDLEERAVIRFQKEAKAMSSLRHTGIVEVYDFGISSFKHPYMILEYVEGKTLEEILDNSRIIREFEEEFEFVEILLQLTSILQYAHSKGIVHRDLKPSNIMLEEAEENGTLRVKILDFGIAKILDESETKSKITTKGKILGSPLYMSPEQIRAESVDVRTDIYSLGCIIYRCLAGKPPFEGDSALEILNSSYRSKPVEVQS